MFVDSHCHLNFDDYQEDLDEVIDRAKSVGIGTMLNICTKLDEASAIIEIAQSRPGIYCTVGVHPHEAKEAVDAGNLPAELRRLATENKVVGLGETGLDFYYEHSPRAEQTQSFKGHIQVAKETGLPLIIHTRDAEEETVKCLDSEKGNVSGVFHCFSGSQHLADKALEMGFYISVSGIVTFKKADELREVIKTVPLERMLLETDAPYLAPVPMRGKRNEPAFMIHTAEFVADLKGVSMEKLAESTSKNFSDLFLKAS